MTNEKTYDYCLLFTYEENRTKRMKGSITAKSFFRAAELVMNTEGWSWEDKRTPCELIYLIKVASDENQSRKSL